jgi:hypothetical protein
MVEIIAIIIFFVSLIGEIIIVSRKIPILLTLSENLQQESFTLKIKKINPFQNFSFEIFLEKILRKIRIFSLKVENFTFKLTQKLKERTNEKHLRELDKYWEKIKKEIKRKFPP